MEKELQQLSQQGYHDISKNIEKLELHQGKVKLVINDYHVEQSHSTSTDNISQVWLL